MNTAADTFIHHFRPVSGAGRDSGSSYGDRGSGHRTGRGHMVDMPPHDAAMTTLILGFFASSWFGWAQERPPAG
jgi:hypothetical protein